MLLFRSFSSHFSPRLVACSVLVALMAVVFLPTPAQATVDCSAQYSCNKDGDQGAFMSCNSSLQACLQSNINELQGQATTLSSTISILNSQISLQESQINQTKSEIAQLETQINDLSDRIDGLNISLDKLGEQLVQRVGEDYRLERTNANFLVLASDSLNKFLSGVKYLQVTREQTVQSMQDAEVQKTSYDEQKTLKEEKQAEVQKKQALLQSQQNELTSQRAAEQNLLSQTQNNEKKFQDLLSQAQAEVASLEGFSSSMGGGVLPEQHSPDGWYFSQRDTRWAGACIGNSCGTKNSATIMEVGCLISDLAMIKKKYGEDVTPLSIARNASYFFSNTAYMLMPWPAPGGFHYVRRSGFSASTVDAELAAGRPVIVHLAINSRDGHFIVLKSGSSGSYVMHDPWEGYDKNFSDFYRTGQITDYSTLAN